MRGYVAPITFTGFAPGQRYESPGDPRERRRDAEMPTARLAAVINNDREVKEEMDDLSTDNENMLREEEKVTAVLSSFPLDRAYWALVGEVAILAGLSQDDIRTFAQSSLKTPIAIRRAIAEGLGLTEAVDWYVENSDKGMHALPGSHGRRLAPWSVV